MRSLISKFRIPVALIAVFLSVSMLLLEGCGGRSSEFVGTWQGETTFQSEDGLTYNLTVGLEVSKDGKFTMALNATGRWLGTDYGGEEFGGSWDSSSNTLTLHRSDQAHGYTFLLSQDGTTLSEQGTNLVLYKANN